MTVNWTAVHEIDPSPEEFSATINFEEHFRIKIELKFIRQNSKKNKTHVIVIEPKSYLKRMTLKQQTRQYWHDVFDIQWYICYPYKVHIIISYLKN